MIDFRPLSCVCVVASLSHRADPRGAALSPTHPSAPAARRIQFARAAILFRGWTPRAPRTHMQHHTHTSRVPTAKSIYKASTATRMRHLSLWSIARRRRRTIYAARRRRRGACAKSEYASYTVVYTYILYYYIRSERGKRIYII